MNVLSIHQLHVYRRASEFYAVVLEILRSVPSGDAGSAERIDQLRRSSESVLRNIAEGAGRWSAQDAMKHYRIARGEAMESVASLDILLMASALTNEQHQRALALLHEVVAMLTKMSRPKRKKA